MPKLIRLLPWLAAATMSLAPAFADIYINIAGTLEPTFTLGVGAQPITATLQVDTNYAFTTGSGKVTDFTFDVFPDPPPYGYDAFVQHITPTTATFCKPEDLQCVITATAGLSNGRLSVTIMSSACCDTLGYSNLSDVTSFRLDAPYPADGQTSLFVFNPFLSVNSVYDQLYSSGAGRAFGVSGTLTVSSTPEPSLYLLLGAGLMGLGWKRRRNRPRSDTLDTSYSTPVD